MWRRIVLNVLTGMSMAMLVASLGLWGLSYRVVPHICWGGNGHRFEVDCGQGTIVFQRLDEYRFDTPLSCGVESLETPQQFAHFQDSSPWWHGDNSWWERIGWTVKERSRWAGVEAASGTYWPPFSWLHPKVPFRLIQLPLWAFVAIGSILPAWRIIRRLARPAHAPRKRGG